LNFPVANESSVAPIGQSPSFIYTVVDQF